MVSQKDRGYRKLTEGQILGQAIRIRNRSVRDTHCVGGWDEEVIKAGARVAVVALTVFRDEEAAQAGQGSVAA